MTYTEFLDWLAFAEVEPLPEARADLRTAQQMALLANVNRDPKRAAYRAADFVPDWWHEAPPVNTVLEKFRRIAERINAHNAVEH